MADISVEKVKKKRLSPKLCIAACVLACIAAAAMYSGLTVAEYTVYSPKLTAGVKALLVTDLHSCRYVSDQAALLTAIDKIKPEVIFLAGDIVDDELPEGPAMEFLRGIAEKYTCFYVSGNHEVWGSDFEGLKKRIAALGIAVLEGNSQSITVNGQTLTICGVDDPAAGRSRFANQLEKAAEAVNENTFTVLLSHRPELIAQYGEYEFDLVVCGHAHGGQWRVPFLLPNGLLAPNQGFFPKYTNGLYTLEKTNMVVSRGLARESTRVPRIFNPPQLVIISMEPCQD